MTLRRNAAAVTLMLLAALTLFALPARAQYSEGQKLTHMDAVPGSAITSADSLQHVNRSDVSGNLYVRESDKNRDHWGALGIGVNVQDVAAGATYKSTVVQTIPDYDHTTLMVSWTTADTDSVAFDLYLVGKNSPNVADGLDYIVDLDPTNATGPDGFFICNPAGYAGFNSVASSLHVFCGKNSVGMATAGTGQATTTNAVAIPLALIGGAMPYFPYVTVWIHNRKGSQMDDITVLLWERS